LVVTRTDGSGVADVVKSPLSSANGDLYWMTEPSGGFNAGDPNMPYHSFCSLTDTANAALHTQQTDVNKSRIKRWIVNDTP
jgi:hypothetical protein